MKVEYSKRAISDIIQIIAYYDRSGNPAVGKHIAARIQEVVTQITGSPLSGRSVVQRPDQTARAALKCYNSLFTPRS
jgi:plasmid stabilization system protein ParE